MAERNRDELGQIEACQETWKQEREEKKGKLGKKRVKIIVKIKAQHNLGATFPNRKTCSLFLLVQRLANRGSFLILGK